jgi:glucosamine-6-phosphate deaminase
MKFLPHNDFKYDDATVQIYNSKLEASQAAASDAASILRRTISETGGARIVVATGNSQRDMIYALVRMPDIDWSHVEVFHMDEYVGLPSTHPASFRLWLKTHLANVVGPRCVYYLNGDVPNLGQECRRYGDLIRSKPLDISFLGFGENGHIAFNDPHVADFSDPLAVKLVDLDEACRRQQVGEGHFSNIESVPREALTVTCPILVTARHLVCCVPERRKAQAVQNALEGPLTTECPASLVRTHRRTTIFLDLESASLLTSRAKQTT